MAAARTTLEAVFSVGLQGLANLSQLNAALRQAADASESLTRRFTTLAWATSHGLRSLASLGKAAVGMTDPYRDLGHTLAHLKAMMGDMGGVAAHQAQALAMSLREVEHAPGDIAKAILEMNRAGLEGGAAVQNLQAVIDTATVSQTNLETATLAVATAYHAWGAPLISTTELLDKFARASNISTFNLGSLMKAMTMAQGAAVSFNQSLSETLTGLAMLAPITGPTTKAGTAFASALKGLTNKKTQQLYHQLGVRIEEGGEFRPISHIVADVIERLQTKPLQERADIMRRLFDQRGIRYAAAVQRVMERGVVDLTGKFVKGKEAVIAYHEKIDKGKVTLKEMADTIRNLSPEAKWQIFTTQMKRTLIEWGHAMMQVLETIRPVLEKFLKALQFFSHTTVGKVVLAGTAVAGMAGMMYLAWRVLRILPSILGSAITLKFGGASAATGGVVGTSIAEAALLASAGAGSGLPRQTLLSWLTTPRVGAASAAFSALPVGTQLELFQASASRRPGVLSRMRAWMTARYMAGAEGFTPKAAYHAAAARFAAKSAAVQTGAGLAAAGLSVARGLLGLLGPIGMVGGALAYLAYSTYKAAESQELLDEQKRREVKLIGVAQDLPELFRSIIETSKRGGRFTWNERMAEMLTQNPTLGTVLADVYKVARALAGGRSTVTLQHMIGGMAAVLQNIESDVVKHPELMTEEGRRRFLSMSRLARQELVTSWLKDQAFMAGTVEIGGTAKTIRELKGAVPIHPEVRHPILDTMRKLKGTDVEKMYALINEFFAPGTEMKLYPVEEVQAFGAYLKALVEPDGVLVQLREAIRGATGDFGLMSRAIQRAVEQLPGGTTLQSLTSTATNPRGGAE